jgi:hypothetical protein
MFVRFLGDNDVTFAILNHPPPGVFVSVHYLLPQREALMFDFLADAEITDDVIELVTKEFEVILYDFL